MPPPRLRLVLLCAVSLLCLACGEGPALPGEDAGVDAGVADAGRTDAGLDAGAMDAGPVDAGPNTPPVVGELSANLSQVYAGQVVELSIPATDADGDVLSYSFSQPSPAPSGTFIQVFGPNTRRWWSAEATSPTTVTLQVSVTDRRSPAVVKQVTVQVRPPRFTEVYSNFLATNLCLGCHGGMGNYSVGGTAQAAWSALVNVDHQRGAGCRSSGFTKLVLPNSAATSLLYRKCAGTMPAACGAEMPRGGTTPPNLLVTLGSWIAVGAPND